MSDDQNTNQDDTNVTPTQEETVEQNAVTDMENTEDVQPEAAGVSDVTDVADEQAERTEAVEEDQEIKEEAAEQMEDSTSGETLNDNSSEEPVISSEGEKSQDEESGDLSQNVRDDKSQDDAPAEEPASDSTDQTDSTDSTSTLNTSEESKNGKWYVVHTYSGHENKVATALKQRVESEHLEHKIFDVLVPTQDKIEIRSGKKETVKEKIFPGYILVKMILDDDSWLAVRTTQGVTSFVGMGNKPTPIPEYEVKTIVKFMTQEAAPTFKDVFLVSDTVKIVDGPFADFIGKVDAVDKDRGKVKVLVSIFGRETPVELDFLQVQKL